ncbi:acetylornithine deacetylase [Natronoarchaeum philippinense]|uniref:Acetylornithine deacetylase n=1 Tax=Natronoarchaeum philippinense TaxID=558529 RepID=A0A285NTX5_NATPI|nr:M20 family metallopeptidase [Natronoarchaeum philippinense]SNZ12889.1 acetylornithine deacetylase [Natronoarchaeum philippinense]
MAAGSERGDDRSDEFDPVAFLDEAVPIESHESVEEMRTFLVDTLAEHGVDAAVDDAGNVVASRTAASAGETAGIHVVLNTHIDTVPPHVPYDRDDERIYGRGSCDAKGPLAVLLAGFLTVDPGDGRLTLAVSPDEETLSTGAAALDIEELVPGAAPPDAVIVGEPTGLDVCNAAKGRFQGTVSLGGENAHAAEPDDGVNAVAAVRELIDAVETFDEREDTPDPHSSLGAPTLTPTTIEGGTATNQVPADCSVVVDRRSVPPETSEGFRSALEAHVRERVPEDVAVEFALTDRESPFLEAFATDTDDPLVETLAEAAGGAVRPFTAATEASYFAAHAPTVVFGPGYLADDEGAVAHSEREYVPIEEVERATDAVAATLDGLLGRRG